MVDVGGLVRTFEVAATKDGRRVDVSSVRGQVEVSELTRSGRPVRTARFMAARVVAIVEHPAAEDVHTPRVRRDRRVSGDQPSLGI